MRIASILRHRLSIKILVLVALLAGWVYASPQATAVPPVWCEEMGVLSGALRMAALQPCFAASLTMGPQCAGGTAC